jgi:hypothetical protein
VDVGISEFLQARITEQEIRCRTLLETAELSPAVRRALSVALVDCQAKRRIIEVQVGYFPDDEAEPSWELMALAYTYSDHPDWRTEWGTVRRSLVRYADESAPPLR